MKSRCKKVKNTTRTRCYVNDVTVQLVVDTVKEKKKAICACISSSAMQSCTAWLQNTYITRNILLVIFCLSVTVRQYHSKASSSLLALMLNYSHSYVSYWASKKTNKKKHNKIKKLGWCEDESRSLTVWPTYTEEFACFSCCWAFICICWLLTISKASLYAEVYM